MFIRLTNRNSKNVFNVAVDDISRYGQEFGSTYVCLKSSTSSTALEVLETPYDIEKLIEEEQEEVLRNAFAKAALIKALDAYYPSCIETLANSCYEIANAMLESRQKTY